MRGEINRQADVELGATEKLTVDGQPERCLQIIDNIVKWMGINWIWAALNRKLFWRCLRENSAMSVQQNGRIGWLKNIINRARLDREISYREGRNEPNRFNIYREDILIQEEYFSVFV